MKQVIYGILRIVLLVALSIYLLIVANTTQDARAFQAWEKLTGNPQHITLEEFVTLKSEHLIKVQ